MPVPSTGENCVSLLVRFTFLGFVRRLGHRWSGLVISAGVRPSGQSLNAKADSETGTVVRVQMPE